MQKLIRYLKPYWLFVIGVIVFLAINALTALLLPTIMAQIVNNGMMVGNISYILSAGVLMLFVAFIGIFASLLSNFFSARIASGFSKDVRKDIFTKVENFSLAEFEQVGASSLVTRSTNDVTQIQNFLNMAFRFVLFSPIMCIGALILAYNTNQKLTLVLVVAMVILIVFIVILSKLIIPSYSQMQGKLDKLTLVLRESLIGIRVIRAFNKTGFEKERFDDANLDLTKLAIKINKIMATLQPTMLLIMNFTTLAIVWFGAVLVGNNEMAIGDIMAFIEYGMMIIFSILMISMMFVMIPRAQASALRIHEVLVIEPEIVDPENPKSIEGKCNTLEFKNVSLTFNNATEPAIQDISFVAEVGKTTAIIGGTGSGKSSILNLMPRFYDPTKGEILINGINIKDITQKELRSKIGFVPQAPILFSGTVKENIAFGSKEISQEKIEHAAKIAQAYDFISEMEQGFDTHIAQGGTNVSGGQKQRLSIARAIACEPAILVFDDSFSALDYKTDVNLRTALKSELTDSIFIVVAQRISTIKEAEQIIVLNDGKIASIGTHSSLLKTCDVYREICMSQLSEEELNEQR